MEHKISKLRRKLKGELDKERYEHTLGVMYTCLLYTSDAADDV